MPIGEREPRPDKIEEVAEIRDLLGAPTIILTDFQGLNVKGISELRKKLRESGSGYRVVKNTLFKLAAVDTAVAPLAEALVGPTAIAYTDADPVAAAKAIRDFAKAAKALTVKSAIVDGTLFDAAQVAELAKIPPKQELYAMVVGGLQGPIYGLVGSLQSMMGQLVMTLQGVADQKAAAA